MRRHLTPALLSLTVLLSVSVDLADAQQDLFDDRTDVVLVQIPVHVSHKGAPIRGLKADNFEVLEGRKKQKIVGLDVVDLSLLDPTDLTQAIVPAASRRNFLFLFDLSNSLPAGVLRAQEAAIEMVRTSLHPADVAGVATYSKDQGLELLLGFTPDREQIIAALETLGLVNPFERVRDPLRLAIMDLEDTLLESDGGQAGPGPGKAALQNVLLTHLKELQPMFQRNNRDIIKGQIIDLSLKLDELAELLNNTSGRKQIVFFSEGFDSATVFGTQDADRIEEITQKVESGRYWEVDSEERFGAGDAQMTMVAMLENFRRSDCAVHTIDVGGIRAGGDSGQLLAGGQNLNKSHDGLFVIANETGGEFYRNTNDLGEAMDDLLDRTSVTYVLSIQPKGDLFDGTYHPLKVRLKDVPRGASISHRPGYYARRSYGELDLEERQMTTAELITSGVEGGPIRAEVLAASFATETDDNYVLTAIEIDGSGLLSGQGSNVVPAEIYTYAFDQDGRVRDFYTQAVGLDLYKVGYRMQTGFKLLSHLRLPPGRYELRTLVRNGETGATGLTRTPIEVPDLHDAQADLLPPFFIEAANRWLVAEGKRDGRNDLPYPLMARGDRLVPAAKPIIPVGQRVPLLLVGNDLPADVEATATFRPADGVTASQSFAVELGERYPDITGSERITAHLRAPGLQAGDYELSLSLADASGAVTASSTIAVSVVEMF